MKYKVLIKQINIVEIDAVSEDKAIELIKNNLVQSRQIKEADPISFEIIEESS